MEQQKSRESAEASPTANLDKAKALAAQNPKALATALKADPKSEGVFSRIIDGMQKGVVSWGKSAWEWTKAAFVWTGEFIGVGAAKLIHEGSDSFVAYASDKTEWIRGMVNVAGDAIAITAFEAVNGDRSVVADAVSYWKEKGVKFSNLSAERQAELLTSFATQVAIGVLWSKGLWAVSKTATAAKAIDAVWAAARVGAEVSSAAAKSAEALHAAGRLKSAAALRVAGNATEASLAASGKAAEKVVKFTAKAGVMASGLDSAALAKERPHMAVGSMAEAANDESFVVTGLRANGSGRPARVESVPSRNLRAVESKPSVPSSPDRAPHAPSEPIDLGAERLERSAKKIEGARKLAEERLLSGEPVFVKRTNGEISVGRVTRIGEDGRIDVAFAWRNGASLHKTLDPLEFRRLNDPEVRLAPEIWKEQLRMRERMAASAERTGKSVESASSEVFRNASMGAGERVTAAAVELKLWRALTDSESTALLKAHAVKADGESAFNFGTKSLWKKMKILQEEGGFTNEQAKTLVRKGFAGEVPVSAERVADIKKLVKTSDYRTQAEFLSTANPKEIGHAFNNGLTDYAADAFEPEFLHAADKAVALYEKNAANLSWVSWELKALVDGLPASVPAEQKKILSGIVERMSAAWAPSFKESFTKAAKASELESLVKALPESVAMREGMDAFASSVRKLAKGPGASSEVARAIDAFAAKFPSAAKESAMLMVETTDPSHWKTANVFKADLGFSVKGDEFRPMLAKMAKENPEKVAEIAKGAATESNYQLRWLQKAAVLEKPFNLHAFRDKYLFAKDGERLDMLLGVHDDTLMLDVGEISARLGKENVDRFFHYEDLQNLRARMSGDPSLAEKVKKVLFHYGRDESGFTKEFLEATKAAD